MVYQVLLSFSPFIQRRKGEKERQERSKDRKATRERKKRKKEAGQKKGKNEEEKNPASFIPNITVDIAGLWYTFPNLH